MNENGNNLIAKHLKMVTADERITTTQLSLFVAILTLWQSQNFSASFKVSRKELMKLSKITGISTYHRCLKHIIDFGYISYEPSYDHFEGSKMTLVR